MIVIFGGSFNPPTIAHYEVAKHVLGLSSVERLLFVPVGDQYKKAALIPAFHRVKMLEKLTKNLPRSAISKIEIAAEQTLRSIETLEILKVEYPDSELAFVMGADNLYDLINWHDYKRLIKGFKIIIINRGEYDVHGFIKENFDFSADNFIIIDGFYRMEVSSSAYRADTRRNDILLPEVETYIRENELYRNELIL